MRRSPLHRQLSESALDSALPKPSPSPRLPPGSAWRGACAVWLPSCLSSRPRRSGERGGAPEEAGPPSLAGRPYGACALPPGLHLGIGRKRERETGTRPGLWCGEKLRQKRKGREGAGTALSHSLSATPRREKEKGRRPGREWGCHPPTLT